MKVETAISIITIIATLAVCLFSFICSHFCRQIEKDVEQIKEMKE